MMTETRDVFFDLGDDASVAVFHHGKLVCEAHSGVLTPQSILLVASSTKFVESTCIALLVDRGLLKYDDLIVDHWPSFARGDDNKRRITVRDLMMHRAGLLYFTDKIPLADLSDRSRIIELLEMQRRRLDIGQGYHAITRGLIAGELLRRVDPHERSLGCFFQEEIAEPLGLRFWIGLPESKEPNVIELQPQANPDFSTQLPYEKEFWRELTTKPNSLVSRTLSCIDYGPSPMDLKTQRQIRACEMPSSNGVGNAVALACLASIVEQRGPIFRKQISVAEACALRAPYFCDAIMGTEVRFTQGGWAVLPAQDVDSTDTVGWGGAGGSMVRFVPSLNLSFAYITRNLGVRMAMNDPRPNAVLAAAIRDVRRAR